jgi:hypothetical protein
MFTVFDLNMPLALKFFHQLMHYLLGILNVKIYVKMLYSRDCITF